MSCCQKGFTWRVLISVLVFLTCRVSDVASGSASQSSSANDISSMSTEHTLASDTDSSSIDTLTGPLDESQWTPQCPQLFICLCLGFIPSNLCFCSFLSVKQFFLLVSHLWSGGSCLQLLPGGQSYVCVKKKNEKHSLFFFLVNV